MNSWGGRGDGPGEFQELSATPYRGDSIMARDSRRWVHSFYDSDGNLGRTLGLNLMETDPSTGFPTAATSLQLVFGDGSFLASRSAVTPLGGPTETVSHPPVTFLRYSAEGTLLDTIGVYATPAIRLLAGDSPLVGTGPPFFHRFVSTADETSVYVGSVDGFEIRRVSVLDGSETLIRASHVDLTTTDADREAYRESARHYAELGRREPQDVERALLEVEFPETTPPFSQLMADSEGYLWVRHYKPGRSQGPETWSVFSPEGYLLGTLETPERLEVRQIGSDFILGVWIDEFDVQFVRKYALVGRQLP
jgi:hypothetical protein